MTCQFARLVGSSGLERFSLGSGTVFLRAQWWLVFPARAGNRDGVTC
jgi:hypothetical protein